MNRRRLWQTGVGIALAVAVLGLVMVVIAPYVGPSITERIWQVEPVAYAGAVILLAGMMAATALMLLRERLAGNDSDGDKRSWTKVTQDYFDTFSHDMGRPLRRILGKSREVRARIEESGRDAPHAFIELLDEIENQAPGFRLMLANVRVLVELEDPEASPSVEPLDPAAIVRNIVDRYVSVAADKGAEVSWWSEPQEFGLAYGDASALDHVVTNLVDNAVKFCEKHVEVRLTRNPTHYFVRVWDDGPGIQPAYVAHIFDRGWTPEVAGRREKTSSGLGLFIARTLARRSGGDIAVESSADRAGDHHTAMTVMLPLGAGVPASGATGARGGDGTDRPGSGTIRRGNGTMRNGSGAGRKASGTKTSA